MPLHWEHLARLALADYQISFTQADGRKGLHIYDRASQKIVVELYDGDAHQLTGALLDAGFSVYQDFIGMTVKFLDDDDGDGAAEMQGELRALRQLDMPERWKGDRPAPYPYD